MYQYFLYLTLILIGICLHHLWSYMRKLEADNRKLSLLLSIYEQTYEITEWKRVSKEKTENVE